MTDEELVKRLRSWDGSPFDDDAHEAAALAPDAVAKMVQDAVEAEREACANVVENHLHDWASDLDATRHELMDARETGVLNGRRVRDRDWLKSEAIRFKERAEAVAESVDHTVAAIRARGYR